MNFLNDVRQSKKSFIFPNQYKAIIFQSYSGYFLPSPSVLSDPGKMLGSRTRSSLGARSENEK